MKLKFLILMVLMVGFFFLNLFVGSVKIPAGEIVDILFGKSEGGAREFIILGSRMPQAVTALMAGTGLTVAGLLLQTAFRNPLAGPSILGISSGAGLGVAIVMLFLGGTVSLAGFTAGGYAAVLTGALLGSLVVMAILLLLSMRLKSTLMLLIAGIMVGYLTSSVVTMLNYFSTAEGIQSYTIWGMGTFGGVALDQLPLFCGVTAVGLFLSVLLMKPLNLLLLGENYAKNSGVNTRSVRNLLLIATGLLTGVITAFCGPVGFIGLAIPHVARMIFRTADHRVLIPGAMLAGAVTGLVCNLLCILPEDIILPLNGVTPLVGVPVILWVIFKKC